MKPQEKFLEPGIVSHTVVSGLDSQKLQSIATRHAGKTGVQSSRFGFVRST
jgi:hypothetical protein